jgi:hypothetical protein
MPSTRQRLPPPAMRCHPHRRLESESGAPRARRDDDHAAVRIAPWESTAMAPSPPLAVIAAPSLRARPCPRDDDYHSPPLPPSEPMSTVPPPAPR